MHSSAAVYIILICHDAMQCTSITISPHPTLATPCSSTDNATTIKENNHFINLALSAVKKELEVVSIVDVPLEM